MKALIVEVSSKYAIALKNSGEFIRVRNNGRYAPGYEYDVSSDKSFNVKRLAKVASVAAVFFIALGMSYGAYSYSKPYSYVDIDINPSIELTVNKYDRIIDSKAFNEDGETLLTKVNFNNKRLESGVEVILASAIEHGFLKQDTENAVMLSVWSKNEKKALKIENEVEILTKERLETAKVETEVVVERIAQQRQADAEELGISPGKMLLIEKLIEAKPELKAEDLKDDTVKDILKSIKEEKKKDKEQEKIEKTEEKANDKAKDKKKDKEKKKDDDKLKENVKENNKGKNKDEMDKNTKEKVKEKSNEKNKEGKKEENKKNSKSKEKVNFQDNNKNKDKDEKDLKKHNGSNKKSLLR